MAWIVPAMNTVWFWFDARDRRALHGTPCDVIRKCELLERLDLLNTGIEIFLMPNRLQGADEFPPSFCRKFSGLPYTSVHIGDEDPDFLTASPTIEKKLEMLAEVLRRLEVGRVVLHAHHLENDRLRARDLLLATLPDVDICVENNGFDHEWGGSLDGLTMIFRDCPRFHLCLDIAHIKDFNHRLSLDDVLGSSVLRLRMRQVHWSFSTRQLRRDPYAARGYFGYGPYHALFSVVREPASARTKAFARQHPVVLEGIVPREDRHCRYLQQEIEILAGEEG